jgi:muconolactone delta-isomerase
MLFLVVSTPRPERPSDVSARREEYWRWLAPLQRRGQCKWGYGRVGRGAVALFDVDANETLHRLLNEWADIIPATFDVYPLIDSAAATRFLGRRPKRPTKRKR